MQKQRVLITKTKTPLKILILEARTPGPDELMSTQILTDHVHRTETSLPPAMSRYDSPHQVFLPHGTFLTSRKMKIKMKLK